MPWIQKCWHKTRLQSTIGNGKQMSFQFQLKLLTRESLSRIDAGRWWQCKCWKHVCLMMSIHARSLCSSNTNLLSVHRVHTTFTSHSFSIAVPSEWNSLQSGIHVCLSLRAFCHLLKTQCFKQTSVPPSSSHKCLIFVLWPTMCTIKDFAYLLT